MILSCDLNEVGEGANSGVYYRPGQYEYQILHNQACRWQKPTH